MESPSSSFATLTPLVTLAVGLAITLVTGSCLLVLIFRCICRKNQRKEISRTESSNVRTCSPGPSDKSTTSKEIDGSESDEKNPDVIPDALESEELDLVRRRQHISTIESNNVNQILLANNPSISQNYSAKLDPTMNIHNSSHNPYGYCTLRNGGSSHQHATIMVRETF